jgi:hypothetical protein
MVGLAAVLHFGDAACADEVCAEATPSGTSVPAMASEAAMATVHLRGTEVMRVQNMFLPFGDPGRPRLAGMGVEPLDEVGQGGADVAGVGTDDGVRPVFDDTKVRSLASAVSRLPVNWMGKIRSWSPWMTRTRS